MLRLMALLRCRPAASLIVAAALAVQALLAGLAGADGVRLVTPGSSELAVICHGGGARSGNAGEKGLQYHKPHRDQNDRASAMSGGKHSWH